MYCRSFGLFVMRCFFVENIQLPSQENLLQHHRKRSFLDPLPLWSEPFCASVQDASCTASPTTSFLSPSLRKLEKEKEETQKLQFLFWVKSRQTKSGRNTFALPTGWEKVSRLKKNTNTNPLLTLCLE